MTPSLESAAAQLGVVLVVIYLIDCFRWVARNAVVFRRLPPFAAHVGGVWQVAQTFRRALVFGFPLPPFGQLLTAEDWPLVAGAAGVRFVAHDAPLHAQPHTAERFVSWSEMSTVMLRGLSLEVGGKTVHTFGSKRAAQAVVELLSKLAQAPSGERHAMLKKALKLRCDVVAIRQRLQVCRRGRFVLALANSLLFVSLFGLLVVLMNGFEARWWWFLVPAGCWCFALGVTLWAVRQLEPTVRPSIESLVVAVISPVSLMRSNDLVEPEWLADFHPAAVACVLLPVKEARAFVDERARAARFPVQFGEPATGDVISDDAFSRKLHLERYEELLQGVPGPAESAPEGIYCPRCLTPYTRLAQACDACHGIKLTRGAPSSS